MLTVLAVALFGLSRDEERKTINLEQTYKIHIFDLSLCFAVASSSSFFFSCIAYIACAKSINDTKQNNQEKQSFLPARVGVLSRAMAPIAHRKTDDRKPPTKTNRTNNQ